MDLVDGKKNETSINFRDTIGSNSPKKLTLIIRLISNGENC